MLSSYLGGGADAILDAVFEDTPLLVVVVVVVVDEVQVTLTFLA